MRKISGIFTVCALALASGVAYAEESEIFDDYVSQTGSWSHDGKYLPPGFHDFRPTPDSVASATVSSMTVGPTCDTWRQAISFGQRLRQGMSDSVIVEDIAFHWGGDYVCGYPDHNYQMWVTEFAIRGDSHGEPVIIFKLIDGYGNEHFVGRLQ